MIDCPRCTRENEDEARFCMGCGENLAAVTSARERKDTYIGQVLDSKFMILDHLGDGGMGKVYKAEQLTLNKIVAIKILHRNLLQNETQVKRFQREAWSASRLDHPHSIGIIDVGRTTDDSHFIAMEYLEGVELTEIIQHEFPISPERIVHIMDQVLSVLHEAHENKIIHRDLKPENIMLIERAEEEDFVKVLDFGIAKLQERDPNMPALTMQGIVCGTPEYMSPEQAMGKELDHRTDIYASGCILYEMLTGEVPFNANNYQAILGMHIRNDPERPCLKRPDLDIHPKIEEIALMAMQKDREMRFPDALAMKRALEVAIRLSSPEVVSPAIQAVNKGGVTSVSAKTGTAIFTAEPEPEAEEEPPPSPVLHKTLMEEPQADAEPEREATQPQAPPATPPVVPKPATPASPPLSSAPVGETIDMDEFDYPTGGGKAKLFAGGAIVLLLALLGGYFLLAPSDGGEGAVKGVVEKSDPEAKPDTGSETIKMEPTEVPKAVGEGAPEGEEPTPAEPGPEKTEIAKTEKKADEKVKGPAPKKPRKLSQMEKQKEALKYYEKGNQALASGNLDRAIRHYNKAKNFNPKSPSVYKKLGMVYMRKGQNKKAKSNLSRYLKMAPKAADAARIRELYEAL